MRPWILAARPKTLVAGFVPVLLGSALAYRLGSFSYLIFLCAAGGALAIQIATNFVNDAADFQKGADTSERLGPPRMAASGLLTPRELYIGAGAFFVLAALFGAFLIQAAGIEILWIGLASIFFGIIYTAGPYPLAYLGFGDLFVLIFFGLVAVCGTVFAHTRDVGLAAILLALASGFQSTALIAVNNLRDIPTDVASGKRTLAVLLGESASKVYFAILLLLPFFLWLPFAASLGTVWGFFPYAAIPLTSRAILTCFRIEDRRQYNSLLARTALIHLLFGVLAAVAMVVPR